MRQTDKIADPSWLDIQDRDKRIAELEAENARLRRAVKRTQDEGHWTYGEFFEVAEAAQAELDAAMEGE